MWQQKTGETHPVVREIDLALAKAMAEEWIGIMIAVRWPRYEVLLRHHVIGKGLLVDPDLQRLLDNETCAPPLRLYRNFSVNYIPHNRLTDYVTGRRGNDTRYIHLAPLPDPVWGDAGRYPHDARRA